MSKISYPSHAFKPELANQTSTTPIEPVQRVNNEHAIGHSLENPCLNEAAKQFAFAFNQLRLIDTIHMHYETSNNTLILNAGDTQYHIELKQEESSENFENDFERIRTIVRGRLEAERNSTTRERNQLTESRRRVETERNRASTSTEREDRSRAESQESRAASRRGTTEALRLLLNNLPQSTQRDILNEVAQAQQEFYASAKPKTSFNQTLEHALNKRGLYLPQSNQTITQPNNTKQLLSSYPYQEPKPKEADSTLVDSSIETTKRIPKASTHSELHKRIAALKESVAAQANKSNIQTNTTENEQIAHKVRKNRRNKEDL